MNLVIFDIDGTLLNTSAIEIVCFLKALELEFGLHGQDTNWVNYTNITDSGIFGEIFQSQFGRWPNDDETIAMIDQFVTVMTKTYAEKPQSFTPLAGALEIMPRISAEYGWRVAIATGGWSASAIFKLDRAGLDYRNWPLATGNDGLAREDILSNCIEKSKRCYKVTDFDKIVSIGDGSWDVVTAKNLNIDFVGVGDEAFFQGLGVSESILDFSNFSYVMDKIAKAGIPK